MIRVDKYFSNSIQWNKLTNIRIQGHTTDPFHLLENLNKNYDANTVTVRISVVTNFIQRLSHDWHLRKKICVSDIRFTSCD